MTDTSATERAQQASEAVRALNHATIFGGGYAWPSDLDATIASLAELAARLPQALHQSARWLAAAHDAGGVVHDGGADVDVVVVDVEASLMNAAAVAAELAAVLDAAHQLTAHLAGVVDDEDGENW